MSSRESREDIKGKDRILKHLASFLEQNRKVLLAILAVGAAAVIVLAVTDSVNKKNAEAAAAALEQTQQKYQEWATAEDEAEKNALREELDAMLENLETEYEGKFASEKAVFIKANIAYSGENWTEAAELYIKAAQDGPDTYLAPISLLLAASATEEAGDPVKALELYTRIEKEYSDALIDLPRVILSVGRLNEKTGNREAAVEAYNRLVDSYPVNGWTAFARTRLLIMGE